MKDITRKYKDVKNRFDVVSKESHEGYITFICPKCYALNVMKHKVKIKLYDSIFHVASIKIGIECWECGEYFKEDLHNGIDPEIAFCIAELNRKGYKTVFSCQGHDGDFLMTGKTGAYVYFKDYLPNEATKLLPECWKLDPPDSSGVQRFGDIIRCDYEKSLKSRIESLTEWVIELPDLNHEEIQDDSNEEDENP